MSFAKNGQLVSITSFISIFDTSIVPFFTYYASQLSFRLYFPLQLTTGILLTEFVLCVYIQITDVLIE
jgi:hypothetical protein